MPTVTERLPADDAVPRIRPALGTKPGQPPDPGLCHAEHADRRVLEPAGVSDFLTAFVLGATRRLVATAGVDLDS